MNGDSAASLTTAPSVVSGTLASANAGTYTGTLTASGAVDGNYTISYLPGTLTINKAPLTVTANNQGMTYGSSMPSLTASYSGFVNGDSAASLTTAPSVVSGTLASANAGTYTGTLTASGAVDGNYTIGYSPGDLTINMPLTTVIPTTVIQVSQNPVLNLITNASLGQTAQGSFPVSPVIQAFVQNAILYQENTSSNAQPGPTDFLSTTKVARFTAVLVHQRRQEQIRQQAHALPIDKE